MYCKNCTHFNWKLSGNQNWGECLNPKVLPLLRLSLRHVDVGKKARDEINTYARIQFDEDKFGCVYFEEAPHPIDPAPKP